MTMTVKIYQTLKTVFDCVSKHLGVRQKYSSTRRILNSPLDVSKCGQTLSFAFDVSPHFIPDFILYSSLSYLRPLFFVPQHLQYQIILRQMQLRTIAALQV